MKTKYSLAVVLILAIAVSFANIGGLDVYALDEAKNAEAAREMLESGNYVVPHFNYELRTDKPPLHYYFMVAGYKLFGVNAFGARFFSSLFGVLTILITFLFSKKYFDQRTALYSALALIASLHFALQFHMSVPDPYLVFFLTWAFFSFYNAYEDDKLIDKLSFYFAIGCGLLTKGPIALGLTGLSALVFLIVKQDLKWSTIWRLQPFGGVLFSLAIALPWFYAVHVQTAGIWTEEFFFKHNINRFSDAMEGHNGIFLLTFGYVFVLGMLSFLPLVYRSIKGAVLDRKKNPVFTYLLVVAAVIICFFAFSSTKLPNYTVPSYPILAVLLGVPMASQTGVWWRIKANRIGLAAYALFMVLFPLGIYFGLNADPYLEHLKGQAWWFIPLSLMGLVLFWLILKPRIKVQLVTPKNVGSWSTEETGKYARLTQRDNSLANTLAIGWILTVLLFFYVIYPPVDAENPVRKTLPTMDTSETVIAYKRLNAAYVFALQKEIKRFDNLDQLGERVMAEESGYVISRTEYREELEAIPGLVYHSEAKDTFENPTTLVMKWGK